MGLAVIVQLVLVVQIAIVLQVAFGMVPHAQPQDLHLTLHVHKATNVYLILVLLVLVDLVLAPQLILTGLGLHAVIFIYV